jgi:predicted nucleic acid-binding protein
MWSIDAGVAVKWFVAEPDKDIAQRILQRDVPLVAPDLLLAEVINALRRKELQKFIPPAAVNLAANVLPQIFQTLMPSKDYIVAAARLSQELDHSVYDCMYLAIGRALSAPLITADAKLVAKVAGSAYAQNVVLLADWKP